MKFRFFFTTICIVLAFICLPFLASAQPGGGGRDPDPGNGGTAAPFDGGISMLIAAGIGYASKKAYDKRKAKMALLNEKE